MQYIQLTETEQRNMLEARLMRFEKEHYNHRINRDLLIESGASDQPTQDAIADAEAAMAALDELHANLVFKLDELAEA